MELNEKEKFIYTDAISFFKTLKGDEHPAWGLMNAQQMIEHLCDSVAIANGNAPLPMHTAEDQVVKWKTFAMSDKDFKPNTPNALLGENPPQVQCASITIAINELENQLVKLHEFYKTNPERTEMNPFFGSLNYAEWVHLFHKHFRHHLRQFGLID